MCRTSSDYIPKLYRRRQRLGVPQDDNSLGIAELGFATSDRFCEFGENDKNMNQLQRITICFLAVTLGYFQRLPLAFAQSPSAPAGAQVVTSRDGQHDFDFSIGTWKTHIRRLQHPLTGSSTWTETNGTVVVRKVWNGRANLEEIEADSPAGHIEGLTLRLYNPQAHQWNLSWANSNDGTLGQPMFGEFNNGHGEFYDQESFKGRSILVRQIYSDITLYSYHFEQAFSDDGGKTWEPNWAATLTRESATPMVSQAATAQDRQHDFDFNFGTWKTHVSRLQHPLTSSPNWVEYDGESMIRAVWDGRGSLFELEVEGPAGHIEGLGLRLYNPQSHQWSLNWANSGEGALTQPMVGEFTQGRGTFFDQESYSGRAILARNGFTGITSDSSRFEQAFSSDGGKTWETNWVMTFTRAKDEPH